MMDKHKARRLWVKRDLNMRKGKAKTNVGGNCGPTILLVHAYVKAIITVPIKIIGTSIHF